MAAQRQKAHPSDQRHDAGEVWRRPEGSGLGDTLRMLAFALVLSAPFLFVCAGMLRTIYTGWEEKHRVRLAAIEAALAYERLVAAPPADPLPVDLAAHGRDLFATTCTACHGATGTGMTGLGKNLLESDFVAANDDDAMLEFLASGRPDAVPVAMPARGGRPDFTDDDLRAIVAYVRGLQDPRRMPELPPMVLAPVAPTEDDKASALAAAGGDEELAEWIASGKVLFARTCAACHGPDGKGMPNLGKDLTTSEFVFKSDEDTLFDFIVKGRNPGEPGNTTGIAMPPKGGNPALSEDDILDIIAYLHSIGAPTSAASVVGGASAGK